MVPGFLRLDYFLHVLVVVSWLLYLAPQAGTPTIMYAVTSRQDHDHEDKDEALWILIHHLPSHNSVPAGSLIQNCVVQMSIDLSSQRVRRP